MARRAQAGLAAMPCRRVGPLSQQLAARHPDVGPLPRGVGFGAWQQLEPIAGEAHVLDRNGREFGPVLRRAVAAGDAAQRLAHRWVGGIQVVAGSASLASAAHQAR